MQAADSKTVGINADRAFYVMLIMVPLGGAATDIYIPSLPAMESYFQADRFAVQATLLVFMAGYGVGQIIAGPLTDSFGRRWPILLSTIVFVAASIGIALAPPLWMVIALRAVQGMFVACSAVGARAIVADCYEGSERIKVANWMTIAWATGPNSFAGARRLFADMVRLDRLILVPGRMGHCCSGGCVVFAAGNAGGIAAAALWRGLCRLRHDGCRPRVFANSTRHGLPDLGNVRVRGSGAVLHTDGSETQSCVLRPYPIASGVPVAWRQSVQPHRQHAGPGDSDHLLCCWCVSADQAC